MSAPFDLDAITLAYGAHDRRTDGVCVMEAVSAHDLIGLMVAHAKQAVAS